MPVLVTQGMVRTLRHLFGGALDETFALVPIRTVVDVDGAPVLDAWGQQVTEAGPPVEGLPCKLRVAETVSRDDNGALVIRRPTLTVAHDLSIQAGDLVTNVRDGEGRLLLARSAAIRVEPAPVGPGAVTTAVELAGAEAVPLPAPGAG